MRSFPQASKRQYASQKLSDGTRYCTNWHVLYILNMLLLRLPTKLGCQYPVNVLGDMWIARQGRLTSVSHEFFCRREVHTYGERSANQRAASDLP